MENPNKNVLVLGATGFIGRCIVEALSKTHLFSVTPLSSKQVDLTDYCQVASLNSSFIKNSIVIMSASLTRDKGNTIEGMLNNIKMASNLASTISEKSISHLIYISTIDVYGRKNLKIPLDESSKIQPSDYYGISKLTSELIFKKISFDKQIPLTILRLSGVYGPGDTHNSPIKVFINSIIKGKRITVMGDGSQMRDFVYVNDISEIIKNICINKITGTYNVSSGKSYSLNNVIEMISQIIEREPNIIYRNNYDNELDLVFNESPLKKLIPSFKFTDLKDGIKQTYKFYEETPRL